MNEYMVKCGNDYRNIYAEDVHWSANCLTFYKDEEVIAFFLNWDYWIEASALKKEYKSENQHS